MSKALTVLAECVDVRSGKRFERGDVFGPAPTPEQAKRLIKAGCLPEAALEAAVEPQSDEEKAAEAAAAKDAADLAEAEAAAAAAKAAKKK